MPSITGYVLDTGIVIELMKNSELAKRVDQRFGLSSAIERNVISVVTVGEALVAVEMLRWGSDRKGRLLSLLEKLVWVDINDRKLLESYSEIDVFGRQPALGAGAGRHAIHMGKNDLWIAATSKVTGLPLITTDTEFDHLEQIHLTRYYFDVKANYSE